MVLETVLDGFHNCDGLKSVSIDPKPESFRRSWSRFLISSVGRVKRKQQTERRDPNGKNDTEKYNVWQ
jgi:hypothetical protein